MPKLSIPFNNPHTVSIKKDCYAMATSDGISAEIVLYGDIVEELPWWAKEEDKSKYIIQDEFLKDLKQIENCKEITIRMHSLGGDADVSNLIHNRLRELSRKGTALICIVDGAAMSGGSLIMCACDKVRVNPSSLIMIHKCWRFFFGGYNADELRKIAEQNDTYDKMQVEIYARKTGLSEEEIISMMAETTYMTGREAVEKGFADEVIEGAEPLKISASADGQSIFVRGKQIRLSPGMFAPDFIPTVETATQAVETNTSNSANAENSEGGTNTMANENTQGVMATENNVETTPTPTATPATDVQAARDEAVRAERERLQGIDEVAHLFDNSLVAEAKYGENACDAATLCHRAALANAKAGKAFMASVISDNENSGAQNVGAAPAEDSNVSATADSVPEAAKMETARANVGELLGKKQ